MSAEFGGRTRPAGQALPVAARTPPEPAEPAPTSAAARPCCSPPPERDCRSRPPPTRSGYRCSCDRVGCPTPARHPISFAWQTQSTTDRAQIERWARHQPQANFITATGMVHDVLDVPLEAGRAGAGAAARRRHRGRPGRRERRRTAALLHPHPRHPRGRGRVVALRTGLPPRDHGRAPGPALALPGLLRPRTARPAPRRPGRDWVRGPEHALPDPLSLLETLTDACARYAGEEPDQPRGLAPPERAERPHEPTGLRPRRRQPLDAAQHSTCAVRAPPGPAPPGWTTTPWSATA